MAKKLFKEIHGPKYDVSYTGVSGMRALQIPHYKFLSPGDALYYIDINNNFEIVNATCVLVNHFWRNRCEIFAYLEKDADKYKEYLPQKNNLKVENAPKDFIVTSGKSNRSHNGLLFTELKEAQEYQAKLINGKAFFQLKPGDTLYGVSGEASEVTKFKVSKIGTQKETYEKFDSLIIKFEGTKGYLALRHLRYEDKACSLWDEGFYCYGIKNFSKWDSGNTYFFTIEEDANKFLVTVLRESRSLPQ